MHGIYKADIILGTGPSTNGNSCDICGDEIHSSHPSAIHERCGQGAFHQACLDDWIKDEPECPTCFKAFRFRRMNGGTRPRLIERLVATNTQPLRDQQAPSSSSPSRERPSAAESGTVTYPPATSKEELPDPEDTPVPAIAQGDTTIPCIFQPTEGLMSLVMSCQASVQALTSQEVWDLMLKLDLLQPRDMIVALRLSSDLDGFSRIYYHRPGTPRDETTLFLTHPDIKGPGTSSSPSSASPSVQGHPHHDDLPVDDQAKVEIERLTNSEALLLERLGSKLNSLRTNIHDARKAIAKLEHQVSHSNGHEDQQALGDPSTCNACGSPLRLPNRRVGRS